MKSHNAAEIALREWMEMADQLARNKAELVATRQALRECMFICGQRYVTAPSNEKWILWDRLAGEG